MQVSVLNGFAFDLNVPPILLTSADEVLNSVADVRYWHLADIQGDPPDVRFRG